MNEIPFILSVQHFIQSISWGVAVTVFFARWLILANIVIALVLLFSKDKRKRHGVYEAAWSFAVAVMLTSALAFLIHRARPFLASSDVALLVPAPLKSAFPSGHTSTAVAVACALAYADPLAGVASFLIAALVAFGRVGVGVHYPTDILGGAVVGALSFVIIRFVHHGLARRDIAKSAAAHHHDA